MGLGTQAVLAPLKFTVKGQAFLSGETPLYADHIVCGALQWGVKTSSTPLLEPGGPVAGGAGAWQLRPYVSGPGDESGMSLNSLGRRQAAP